MNQAMHIQSQRLLAIAVATASLAFLSGCGGSGDDNDDGPAPRSVASLRLIGQQVLPRRAEFQGTVVGGLSGIDYDAASDRYTLVSDDRTTTDSPTAPRMYTAQLDFDATAFRSVQMLSTFSMKQPGGATYPKVPDLLTPDPEAVRIDPVSGNLLWTSEGERTPATPTTSQRLIDPFIREIRPDGTHVREYALPAIFSMSAAEKGPRGNLVFEGLAVTPDRAKVFVLAEGPLYEDGPAPTLTAGAISRITVFDRANGTATAQYAYPVERVQVAPVPAGQFSVSGATEILAITDTRFLVLERSFSVGVIGNQVRLYEIDIGAASDVLNVPSLASATYAPVSKRLVLDFETLKASLGGIANLEGMAFGPRLANGHESLIVVADDNFPTAASDTDRNQFLVFDVQP
jgi:hypothetical protein